MTRNQRIENVIGQIDGVLLEEPPSPELRAVMEAFEALTPRQRWRVMVLMQLQDSVRFAQRNIIANAQAEQELADLKRWGRDMGRLARRLPGDPPRRKRTDDGLEQG